MVPLFLLRAYYLIINDYNLKLHARSNGSGADFGAALGAMQRHFIIPADFAGTPTLTLPCGFSDGGLPHGVQLMGEKLSEPMLCRIGHAFEDATEWHQRHPAV